MKLILRLPLLVGLLACASLPVLQAKQHLAQTILPFPAIPTQTFPEAPFLIEAPTTTSGLPVTIEVKSGPATLVKVGSNYKLLTTGTGSVILVATQAGDKVYGPARYVSTRFAVKLPQKIGLAQPEDVRLLPNVTYSFNVAVKSSSGLPVDLRVDSGNASVAGRTVTVYGRGTVVLVAEQGGNSLYAPAIPVTKSFVVKVAGGGGGG